MRKQLISMESIIIRMNTAPVQFRTHITVKRIQLSKTISGPGPGGPPWTVPGPNTGI
jgi:hypothetical protein